MLDDNWLLSIDGGGTKTDLCIARKVGDKLDIVNRVRGGPANLTVQPVGDVIFELDGLISSSIASIGVPIDRFQHVVVGLAGAGDTAKCQRVFNWIESRFCGSPIVCSDGELILMLAEKMAVKACGTIALLVGTGSVAFFKDAASEEVQRVGGWGPIFGDQGSGYDMGREAVRHLLRRFDQGEPLGTFAKDVLQKVGASTPRELISRIHEADNHGPLIAKLAAVVLKAAANGDTNANHIVRTASTHISELVRQAIQRMSCPPDQVAVACVGGLLANESVFSKSVTKSICAQKVEQIHVINDPAVAAFQLCGIET